MKHTTMPSFSTLEKTTTKIKFLLKSVVFKSFNVAK